MSKNETMREDRQTLPETEEMSPRALKLLKIAEYRDPEEWNQVIATEKDASVLYHYSHLRRNLLEWIPFGEEDSVLEVGGSCGALTGLLAERAGRVVSLVTDPEDAAVNRARHFRLRNLTILQGDPGELLSSLEGPFDHILLPEELYRLVPAREELELLCRLRVLLKEKGKLYLAASNRLALTALAGSPRENKERLHTRKEWQALLKEAGFEGVRVMYPYPDQVFPLELYSDERLPGKGELKDIDTNFTAPRVRCFSETRVFDDLIGNGLFGDFSAAFLLEAQAGSPAPEQEHMIYVKYSDERRPGFHIRTMITGARSSGREVRRVYKRGLTEEAGAHLLRMAGLGRRLDRLYREEGILCNVVESTDEDRGEIRLSYISGESLEERLDRLSDEGNKEQAEKELRDYLKEAERLCAREPFRMTEEFRRVFGDVTVPEGEYAAPVTNIDMVCQNLILGSPRTMLDYEWSFDFPVPAGFVLYRILYYYGEAKERASRPGTSPLYLEFGINEEKRQAYAAMEKAFQSYITGGFMPLREMYQDISPGVLEQKYDTPPVLQVFFGTPDGYREENSVLRVIKNRRVCCRITLPEGCTDIRLDPCPQPCAMHFRSVSFDGIPADLAGAYILDGLVRKNWAYLPQEDPAFFGIPVPEGARALELDLMVYPADPVLLRRIIEMEDMRDTKIWKLYTKYKRRPL